METKEVVAGLLTENTGRHILDSGDAYGRHWQRNQKAAGDSPVEFFESLPPATWEKYSGVVLNVYHFLVATCDYNERLDRAFHKWVYSGPEDRLINGCGTADEFIEALVAKGWADKNDEWNGQWTNTYNSEDALSQVIQYVCVALTDECPWGEGPHVLLSVHNGADVRGGYTALRAFASDPWESPSLFDNARVTLYCGRAELHRKVPAGQMDFAGNERGDVYYHADSDDGGYSWYSDEHDDPVSPEDDGECPLCPLCNEPLEAGGYF